jgi:hypothetical protein
MNLPVNYNDLSVTYKRMVREEYQWQQRGICCHCGELLSENPSIEVLNMNINKQLFPKGFFNWPIHLHHNHETGMTIGAVHNRCNAALWQYYGE